MAQNLGVTLVERDQSKTVAALDQPAGAMAVYALRGRTDEPVLCRSEEDIRRNLGEPASKQTDAGATFTDYNRGLQNAYNFVRAGQPMYLSRAIPSASAPVKASVDFQEDSGADAISAEALGHGAYYNGLTIIVTGLETVSRKITLVTGTAVSLDDNVMPGTLKITDGTDTDYDGPEADGTPVAWGDVTATMTGIAATGNITLTYEDSVNTTDSSTTLTAATGVEVTIEYERTTTQKLARIYIVDDGETDPRNNYYETYLVSYKESGKDEGGNAVYIADVINETSELIKVTVSGSYDQDTLPLGSDPYGTTAYSANVYGLAGGTEGEYAASDADIKTALQPFRQKRYDIVKLWDAGYDDTVKKELGVIAAYRKFAHAYIDPKMSLFIESGNTKKAISSLTGLADDLVDWRMGLGNQEFMSIAGSTWGRITDEFNGGRKLWMPPTYKVGAAAIIIDQDLGPWNTVMGPRRGVLDFEELVANLYEYRNTLNAKQVNPLIIDERGVQMYYGNKTCKLTASQMQLSTARKTRSGMSREFYFSALDYVAENIVDATYNDLRDEFEAIVERYADALEDYEIVVGPPKTTQADINQQILRIGVALIFNTPAEEIIIETTVFKNGDELSVDVV